MYLLRQQKKHFLIIALAVIVLLPSSFVTIYAIKKFNSQQKDILVSFYNSFIKEVIFDIDRANLILSIAAEKIKPLKDNPDKIQKYIEELNTHTLFTRIRNYKLLIEKCTENSSQIYQVHDIAGKLKFLHSLEQGRCLVIEVDYNELLHSTKYFADSNHIFYVLSNTEKKSIISNLAEEDNNYQSQIRIDKTYKNGIKVSTWINKNFVAEKHKEIILLAALVILIVIICSIWLCVKFQNYLLSTLHKYYESQLKSINMSYENLIHANSELEKSYKQLKGTVSIRNEIHNTIVQGLKESSSNIVHSLAALIEKIRGSKSKENQYIQIETELQKLFCNLLAVSEQKVFIEGPELINLEEIIEKSIAYWLSEIQEKKVNIVLSCKISELHLPYNKITITQILCSLIGLVITTLPKGKQLTINITANDPNIEIELIDNGFHFSLEELDKHTRNNSKMFSLLLVWEELITTLKTLNIKYQSSSSTETGNKFKIFLSQKDSLDKEVKNPNVVVLSNYKKS